MKKQNAFPEELFIQRVELDDTLDPENGEDYKWDEENIFFDACVKPEQVFDKCDTWKGEGEEVAIYKLVKIVKMEKKVSVKISQKEV